MDKPSSMDKFTLRDWYTGMALAGRMALSASSEISEEEAGTIFDAADTMLKVRRERKNEFMKNRRAEYGNDREGNTSQV